MSEFKSLPQTHCNETVWTKNNPWHPQQCSRKKPVEDENQDWKYWKIKEKVHYENRN